MLFVLKIFYVACPFLVVCAVLGYFLGAINGWLAFVAFWGFGFLGASAGGLAMRLEKQRKKIIR